MESLRRSLLVVNTMLESPEYYGLNEAGIETLKYLKAKLEELDSNPLKGLAV